MHLRLGSRLCLGAGPVDTHKTAIPTADFEGQLSEGVLERLVMAGCSLSRSSLRADLQGERLTRRLPLWANRGNLSARPEDIGSGGPAAGRLY
jgi:hypothetical protein